MGPPPVKLYRNAHTASGFRLAPGGPGQRAASRGWRMFSVNMPWGRFSPRLVTASTVSGCRNSAAAFKATVFSSAMAEKGGPTCSPFMGVPSTEVWVMLVREPLLL